MVCASVTRDRINHLPGAKPLTWLDWCYYERTLLAAVLLVGLCIYATVTAPKVQFADDQPPPLKCARAAHLAHWESSCWSPSR